MTAHWRFCASAVAVQTEGMIALALSTPAPRGRTRPRPQRAETDGKVVARALRSLYLHCKYRLIDSWHGPRL